MNWILSQCCVSAKISNYQTFSLFDNVRTEPHLGELIRNFRRMIFIYMLSIDKFSSICSGFHRSRCWSLWMDFDCRLTGSHRSYIPVVPVLLYQGTYFLLMIRFEQYRILKWNGTNIIWIYHCFIIGIVSAQSGCARVWAGCHLPAWSSSVWRVQRSRWASVSTLAPLKHQLTKTQHNHLCSSCYSSLKQNIKRNLTKYIIIVALLKRHSLRIITFIVSYATIFRWILTNRDFYVAGISAVPRI